MKSIKISISIWALVCECNSQRSEGFIVALAVICLRRELQRILFLRLLTPSRTVFLHTRTILIKLFCVLCYYECDHQLTDFNTTYNHSKLQSRSSYYMIKQLGSNQVQPNRHQTCDHTHKTQTSCYIIDNIQVRRMSRGGFIRRKHHESRC